LEHFKFIIDHGNFRIFNLKNEERALFEEVLIAQQRVEDTSKSDEVRLHPSHKFAYSKVLKQIDQTKLDNSAKDKVS
jgi:hypothetical protein